MIMSPGFMSAAQRRSIPCWEPEVISSSFDSTTRPILGAIQFAMKLLSGPYPSVAPYWSTSVALLAMTDAPDAN